MMDIKEAIAGSETLSHVNPSSLSALASFAALRCLRKGEHLFYDKDEIAAIHFVASGMITLYKVDHQGDKRVIFALGPGKMISEAVFDELPASINCEALEDSVILCFEREKFQSLMERDFELAKAVMNSLSMKVRRLYRQLKNTSGSIRGEKRVAAKLWKLSMDLGVPCEDGVRIDMKLSITYLADMLGSKRETVSRQVNSLARLGLVAVRNGSFIIQDRGKLADFFKK